jgi:hypothetical protein
MSAGAETSRLPSDAIGPFLFLLGYLLVEASRFCVE